MLTKITLKNFKCFKEETEFPLSKINLLTGINGKGKSTLLQSLLLMRQSIEHNENTNQIYLNGSCVNLGTFEDVKNNEDLDECNNIIFFSFDFASNIEIYGKINYFISPNESNDNVMDIRKIELDCNDYMLSKQKGKNNISLKLEAQRYEKYYTDEIYVDAFEIHANYNNHELEEKTSEKLDNLLPFIENNEDIPEYSSIKQVLFHTIYSTRIHQGKIHYCSADRLGPQNSYPKLTFSKFVNVGAKGQFTADVLFKNKNNEVYESLFLKGKNTLAAQTDAWIDEILGENLKVSVEDTRTDIFILTFYSENGKIDYYKPSNVGFGYSYILPIIVSGLIAKSGEILIVENPEAHLHPRAQSKLTKFLAKVASCGVQVFIESHSEHILNGLRVCALDASVDMSNEDMSVLYFQDKENEPFVQVPINKDGSIDNWADGFFDQTDKDFKILFGL